MKYRAKNSKIKYQHSIIAGLRPFLEEKLQPIELVKSIIPGEIKATRNPVPRFHIAIKYKTGTGLKLLAYCSGAVQEVFITTNEPDKLQEKLKDILEKA